MNMYDDIGDGWWSGAVFTIKVLPSLHGLYSGLRTVSIQCRRRNGTEPDQLVDRFERRHDRERRCILLRVPIAGVGPLMEVCP